MKCLTSLRSSRSSSQAIVRCSMATASGSRDDDFLVGAFTAAFHDEGLERARGRPGHHVAAEIISAVVTRAPQLRRVRFVLHGAVQMRAYGAERVQLAVGGADD